MTLPGFTAEVFSSFPKLKGHHYWSQMKGNVYVKQQVLFHNTTDTWRNNSWEILPEPQKEPSESGRRAWKALEKACDNLQCEECRNDCVRFINGLHDAINIKLGKSAMTPNDFIYLRDFINEIGKHAYSNP